MSNGMPYIRFFPRDWMGDSLLRVVSPAARGVWMDLLCIMAMSDPYGYLAVNGRPMSNAEASRLIGTDEATYKGYLDELITVGIPGKTPENMLFSRRLVRDHEAFLIAQASGRKGGGNPALKHSPLHPPNQSENLHLHKPSPNARVSIKVPIDIPIKAPIKVDFDTFWAAYPEKVGKQKALKAWNSAKERPPIAEILGAIERAKTSRRWLEGYIPNPATWLNEGRWTDEPSNIEPTASPSRFPARPPEPMSEADRDALCAAALAKARKEGRLTRVPPITTGDQHAAAV